MRASLLHAASFRSALLLAGCVGLTGPSGAQESGHDLAAARALFAEGRKLAAEKNYEQACPKFEESYRLGSGLGTLLNLADCWEHVGKTASAWARFLDVAAEAQRSGQSAREKVARTRASSLEPKLSRLTLEVRGAVPGLEVRRDGIVVGSPSWGVAVPTDPGKHVVEAQAPDKALWTTTVDVPASGHAVVVEVPPLGDRAREPGSAAGAKPANPAAGGVAEGASTKGGEFAQPAPVGDLAAGKGGSGPARTVIGLGLMAVGVGGLVVGTFYALRYKSRNDDALALCLQGCKDMSEIDQHASLVGEATTDRNIAVLGLAGGGAALAGGLVLLLTGASKGNSARQTVQWVPLATGRGVAALVTW